MSSTDEPGVASLSLGGWLVAAAAIVGVAIVLHALFPRYEMTTHGSTGDAVVVFDRWTGQFQRAMFGTDGQPQTSVVVRPF